MVLLRSRGRRSWLESAEVAVVEARQEQSYLTVSSLSQRLAAD